MSRLALNLHVLRERDPDLAARFERAAPDPAVEGLEARSGAATLRVAERLEASAEDPVEEGRRLAEDFLGRARDAGAGRLVLFGMGVHTLAWLAPFEGPIIVVEPSLAVARAVLERVDLGAALRRVELLVEAPAEQVLRHPRFTAAERGLFLAHPSARRRAGELHDRLARHFHPRGEAAPLDVAVVPPLYGGSLPVAQACARALRELGHRVRYLDLSRFWPAYEAIELATADDRLAARGAPLRAGLVRLIGNTILCNFAVSPPDLVLALAQAPLDSEALRGLARLGCARALWFCEDFRVMTYWRALAGEYDVVFHVQPDAFQEPLRQAGARGVPLPMAFDPTLHRPASTDEDPLPLSFVGAAYHNRVRFLPSLFDLGLVVYGTGWPLTPPFRAAMPRPNERLTPEESNRVFQRTRVNLNLHSSPWCDGVNPVGDFLNPRVFELAGAGAFQLVDERSELRRHFEPGVHLETYRDLEECRRKARHFLAREDEGRAIAAAAREHALEHHTFRHRMEQAVDALRSGPLALAPRQDRQRTAGAVAAGAGELTEAEKLLLYMREARREVRIESAESAAA